MVKARILDRDPDWSRALSRELILSMGERGTFDARERGLPFVIGGCPLEWFAHQTDDVGAAHRAEIARRERLEAEP